MFSLRNSTMYKEELMLILRFFQKTEEEETLLKSFCQANITLIQNPGKDIARKNYKPVLPMNMDAKIPQQDTRKTNLETYKNSYTL